MNIFQQSKRSISTCKKSDLNLEAKRGFSKDMLWGPKTVVYINTTALLIRPYRER